MATQRSGPLNPQARQLTASFEASRPAEKQRKVEDAPGISVVFPATFQSGTSQGGRFVSQEFGAWKDAQLQ